MSKWDWCVGDQFSFLKNDKGYTVTAIDGDRLTVTLSGGVGEVFYESIRGLEDIYNLPAEIILRHPSTRILDWVEDELERIYAKWGANQHHPNGTDVINARYADFIKEGVEYNRELGILSWADILLEEFAEALSEEDPDRLIEELIQVAAVAVDWIRDIRATNGQ